jgi:outer membrane protein OmpA-like peptidoglycan-associated protein
LRRSITWGLAALAIAALQACGTRPTSQPAPGPSTASPAAPAGAEAPPPRIGNSMAVERLWLQAWFKGTPVRITQRHEAAVRIEVPRDFCFDAGRSTIKPALAAVLDKLAQSLDRADPAWLPLVAAPADSAKDPALAVQRAARVREHLLALGVPAARLGPPIASTAAAVQLRMEVAPQ